MRIVACPIAAALLLALTACGKPKEQAAPPPPAPAAPAATSGAAAGPPMPALPAWSAQYVGKALATFYPGDHPPCLGNTDVVLQRYGGASPGVQIAGWGWDPEAKAPIGRILIVDGGGNVAGAGESGYERPDVNAARPEIKSTKTGWAADTTLTKGPIDAYGLVGGGKTVCRLGHLDF